MNMKGMLALLKVVDKITPTKTNMGSWFAHKGNVFFHNGKVPHTKKGVIHHGCGTTACWLGHAALDPAFQKVTGITLGLSPAGTVTPVLPTGERNTLAAAIGLDISVKQVDYLFGSMQSGEKEDLKSRWWDVVTGMVA